MLNDLVATELSPRTLFESDSDTNLDAIGAPDRPVAVVNVGDDAGQRWGD